MALIGNFSGVWHLYQFQLYLGWCREVVKTNNYHMCCKCNISRKKSKFVHPIQAACIAVFTNFGLLLTCPRMGFVVGMLYVMEASYLDEEISTSEHERSKGIVWAH